MWVFGCAPQCVRECVDRGYGACFERRLLQGKRLVLLQVRARHVSSECKRFSLPLVPSGRVMLLAPHQRALSVRQNPRAARSSSNPHFTTAGRTYTGRIANFAMKL